MGDAVAQAVKITQTISPDPDRSASYALERWRYEPLCRVLQPLPELEGG